MLASVGSILVTNLRAETQMQYFVKLECLWILVDLSYWLPDENLRRLTTILNEHGQPLLFCIVKYLEALRQNDFKSLAQFNQLFANLCIGCNELAFALVKETPILEIYEKCLMPSLKIP